LLTNLNNKEMKKYLLISCIILIVLWITILILKAHLGGEYEPPMWAQIIIISICGNAINAVVLMIIQAARGKLF